MHETQSRLGTVGGNRFLNTGALLSESMRLTPLQNAYLIVRPMENPRFPNS